MLLRQLLHLSQLCVWECDWSVPKWLTFYQAFYWNENKLKWYWICNFDCCFKNTNHFRRLMRLLLAMRQLQRYGKQASKQTSWQLIYTWIIIVIMTLFFTIAKQFRGHFNNLAAFSIFPKSHRDCQIFKFSKQLFCELNAIAAIPMWKCANFSPHKTEFTHEYINAGI